MREVIINNETRLDALSVIIGEYNMTLNVDTTLSFDNLERIFRSVDSVTVDGKEYLGYTKLHYIQKVWTGENPAWIVNIENVYDDTSSIEIITGETTITYDEAIELRKELEDLAASIDMTDEQYEKYGWLFKEWNGNNVSYSLDEKVRYEGKIYKCIQAHVSQPQWNPVDAASLWANVLIPPGPDPHDIPVWVQPSSTNPYMMNDMVKYPDENGSIYKSTIDNNIWSPETYPQGWTLVE